MNKHQILEEIQVEIYEAANDRSATKPASLMESYWNGFLVAMDKCNKLVEQLDEPKKVVVPKEVAEFVEDGNFYEKIAFLTQQKMKGIMSPMQEGPVKNWLRHSNYETVLSLINGYEVKQVNAWVVKVGNMYFVNYGDDGCSPTFVLNDILGQEKMINKFKSENRASLAAMHLGGTVEPWED
ncbi:hypothetical protein IGI37_000076 [Enterococcus sp. AZ194]|uniref:DUF1642 domain-containing protein n=1 Tax=Enterococcus sp. AZ194 TaxID=2774629 RepID=UPI003F258B21